MDAMLAIAAGAIALVAAAAILGSLGPRQRIGRLLKAAPRVSVAEALELARVGRAPYVRIDGRIDSEAAFEDADHRPLVLRQTRIQVLDEGGWRDVEVARDVVPFEIREGLTAISIDGESLGDGLVVIPRESVGVAGDLGERIPDDVADDVPARIVIEQVSSVEHAIALGVPAIGASGQARLGPGRGRPLVLTTLEPPEAIRVLGAGPIRRRRIAATLVVVAAALVILGLALLVLPGDVLAASPEPTTVAGADTRSAGEGPGFVGALGPAFLSVLAVAGLTIALTLAWIRLTDGRSGSQPPRRRP